MQRQLDRPTAGLGVEDLQLLAAHAGRDEGATLGGAQCPQSLERPLGDTDLHGAISGLADHVEPLGPATVLALHGSSPLLVAPEVRAPPRARGDGLVDLGCGVEQRPAV